MPYIASMVGVSKDILENHLHCLLVLRNKCAHVARMYNTDFNPPAKFTTTFLRKNPEIKNNSLFAYMLVLLKRLPDEESKKPLVQTVEMMIDEYRSDIDLSLIGFQENYLEIMKNNLLRINSHFSLVVIYAKWLLSYIKGEFSHTISPCHPHQKRL